jgi:Family of unknown function (DUF6117)
MLNPRHVRNFAILVQAAVCGDLALVECKERSSGLTRHVIVAVNRDRDGNYLVMPFGHLHDGDPFEFYQPPEPTPDPTDRQTI